jgi:iron complex outermembrane receptor protein
MKENTLRNAVKLALWSGMAFGFAASSCAQAQEKKDEPGTVETITVTGSSIPTTPSEAAVPVTVLGAKEIEATGVNSNALELLRKAVPSFAGRSNTGNSNANNNNQNTAGGSQIQLRNLDTLVLVNGRRMASSGINAIGGKNFVDINQIPVAAIERIEVLSDGASSIYGSDAIGGVVNLILKSEYEGAEIGGRYGIAPADGRYTEKSLYFVTGAEPRPGTNFTISGSWSETDPLYQHNRPFDTPLVGRVSAVPGAVNFSGRSPGALLAPGLNSPRDSNPVGPAATATSIADLVANGTYVSLTPAQIANTYDISQFQTLVLKQDQRSLIANGNAELMGKKLVAFGDLMLSQTKSFTQFLPLTTTVSVPAGAPYNPLTTNLTGATFAYWPLPKQFNNDANGERATLGLRGDLSQDWNWETAYVYGENKLTQKQANVFYAPNIARAIAGGFDAQGNAVAGGRYSRVRTGFSETGDFVIQPALDPLARADGVDPASLANVFGTEQIDVKSKLTSFDFKVVGVPFALPAGKVGIAVGANFRKEELSGHTDPNGFNTGPTNHLWSGGTFTDPFSADRTIKAAFAEVRVPITGKELTLPAFHAFDLVGAVRTERYSDAGNSTVPKIGFRWEPVDKQLVVRGTYSRAFTAPTLFSMFGPTGTRVGGSGIIQSAFGIPGLTFPAEDGNNPSLKPSDAWSRSIGAVFVPDAVPGLRLKLDFVNVTQKGFPGGIGFANIFQSVNANGAASPFISNIARGNFPGQPGTIPGATAFAHPGDLLAFLQSGGQTAANDLYTVDYFVNLAGLKVRAYDFFGEYALPATAAGKFTLMTVATYFQNYKFQALPDQPFFEYSGYATNGGTGVQGTLPKYRFFSTVHWEREAWEATLANTFIPSVTDIGTGGIVFATSTTLKPIRVASYTSWDANVGYTAKQFFKGLRVMLGVNNLANRMPPAAPQAFTDNNVDVATYSPIGRIWWATVSVKF